MPRLARVVVTGVAHHVTQRGTGRQTVFHTRSDRRVYLRLLTENSHRAGLRILAYCLMPNHIHLIAVPEREDSLAVALRRAHGRYAQYFNARKLRSGHLWQNRFYSCPMDQSHLWTAIRYVELNPTRANLAGQPGEYEWSSAPAHLLGRDPHHTLDMSFWLESGGAPNWADLLSVNIEPAQLIALRRATHAGRPLGSTAFQTWVNEQCQRPSEPLSKPRRGPASEHSSANEKYMSAG
jgi:putative transposase